MQHDTPRLVLGLSPVPFPVLEQAEAFNPPVTFQKRKTPEGGEEQHISHVIDVRPAHNGVFRGSDFSGRRRRRETIP